MPWGEAQMRFAVAPTSISGRQCGAPSLRSAKRAGNGDRRHANGHQRHGNGLCRGGNGFCRASNAIRRALDSSTACCPWDRRRPAGRVQQREAAQAADSDPATVHLSFIADRIRRMAALPEAKAGFSLGGLASRRRPLFWSVSRRDAQ
jgi:hypothetical protein